MAWLEQYERIQRGLERIGDTNKPREDYEDNLFNFFMDCWHLKDWIANDVESISYRKRKNIVAAVHADNVLMICREIANARKHLKLRGRKKRRRPPKPKAHLVGDIKLGLQPVIDYGITDSKGKNRVAARQLAEQAVQKWADILRKRGLKLPV